MTTMRLSIRHTTQYLYSEPVTRGLQRLRLTPKTTQGQQILNWNVQYQGAREELSYEDQNCNHVTLISAEPGTREVLITCTGEVQTDDNAGVIGQHSGHLPLWAFLGHTNLTRPGPRIRQLASQAGRGGERTLEVLHGLSALIAQQVEYVSGVTAVDTAAEEAVLAGKGVCQDHAHIFIAAARHLEFPARYVSGYLLMDDRVEQDATHAWAEAYVEPLGWVGFDISNGISPDPRYVRLATGRDYRDAAPVTGMSFGAGSEELVVSLAVAQQIAEQ